MKPSDAAKRALETFEEIQGQRQISDVLVEAIDAPASANGEWHVTIGYAPTRDLLGVPVSGARLRSVVRLAEDGSFVGMRLRERHEP